MVKNYFEGLEEELAREKGLKTGSITSLLKREKWQKVLDMHKQKLLESKKKNELVEYFCWLYFLDNQIVPNRFTIGDSGSVESDILIYMNSPNLIPKFGGINPIGSMHLHPHETVNNHLMSEADRNCNRTFRKYLKIELSVIGVMDGIIIFAINDNGVSEEVMTFSFKE